MAYLKDPRVDAYLAQLPEWQRELGEQLRQLIHAVDPEIAETIKRRVQPYFVLEGTLCALLGTKDHLNLFLYDGGLVPDPAGLITGGHDNETARTISFYRGDKLTKRPLLAMLRQIIANNRAGGWRKLKAAQ